MNEQQIQNLLYTKPKDKMVEMFDNLTCPPIGAFFSIYDIQYLYNIATSVKLTSKPKVKYRMIDDLMKPKGFVRLHAGTNRIVYRHLDITSFVAKIAIDDKGLGDNPAEYRNQLFLKPFVTKTFEVTYNGVLAFSERVDPITSLASFLLISPDVFDVLVYKILGNYFIDYVGSDYFMNWGVRKGIGPCLLDYPYVYNLDSNKLYCNRPVYPNTKFPVCNGEIDYDEGFNNLVCTVCGKRYIAKDLAKDIENNLVYFKGGSTMDEVTAKIRIYKGNKLLNSDIQESASIKKPLAQFSSYGVLEIPKITIKRGKTIIACSGGVDNKKSVSKQKQVEHSTSSERKTNNYKPNYNNSAKKEEVVEADPIVPVQNDPLKEARERLKLKNAIKAETEITMPEVPDGLVEDKFVSKPIPVIIPEGMPMNENEEQRQYNIEHINNEDGDKNINNENFGPLSQGFMSGISVDSVCGIVSGRSYEEIKEIEAKEKQEALEKTKEESVVLPEDQVSNDHSFTQFEEVENDEDNE